MSVSKSQILLILLFILYPLGALPFIIVEIYNNKKYAYTLLALFMGLMAVLFPPYGDLYRHTLDYWRFQEANDLGWIVTVNGLDFFLYSLSNFFGKVGVNFEIVRFIFVFITYEITFWIFRDILKNNSVLSESNKYRFMAFLCAFMIFEFVGLVSGLRFTLSTYLVTLAIYIVYFKNNRLGWLWAIPSVFTHFGSLLVLLPAIGVKVFSFFRLNKRFTIFTMVVLALFSVTLMTLLIEILPLGAAGKRIAFSYVTNADARVAGRSINALFAMALSSASIPFLGFYFFKNKELNKRYSVLICSLFIITFMMINFLIPFTRMLFVLKFMLLIVVLTTFSIDRFKTFMLQLIFCALLLSQLSMVYAHKEALVGGNIYQFVYKPAPLILLNHFDKYWVDDNINHGGVLNFNL